MSSISSVSLTAPLTLDQNEAIPVGGWYLWFDLYFYSQAKIELILQKESI